MRCEVIAEIGINHCGDIDMAEEMIFRAKGAGADTVKFQFYSPHDYLKKEDFSLEDWECIVDAELDLYSLINLQSVANHLGIGFLVSAADEKHLEVLEKHIKPSRHKIPAHSADNWEYVKAVQATKKPYIVSINPKDAGITASWHKLYGNEVSVLYCISKYPSTLPDLQYFPDDYGLMIDDGLSCHCPDIFPAQMAIARRARIVEKHVTLSRDMPGPDHKASITFDELEQLCVFRDKAAMIGRNFLCDQTGKP